MSGMPFGNIMQALQDVEHHIRRYNFAEARKAAERLNVAIDLWEATEAVRD